MEGNKRLIIERFYETQKRLRVLMDENPRAAIIAARGLMPDDVLGKVNIDIIKAATFIDAGAIVSDRAAVDEGIDIFTRLRTDLPNRDELDYNLANGLFAQSDLDTTARPDWFLKTSDARRQARSMFQQAGVSETSSPQLVSESFTNLGNSLLKSGRLVEAYNSYIKALSFDPTNGIALTGAAKNLIWFDRNGIGNSKILRGVASKHLKIARDNPNRIRDLAGKQAFESLSKLLENDIPGGVIPDLSKSTHYQQFVAKHRLALSPTIEGLDLSLPLWDSLGISRVTESIDTPEGAPPIFAMYNMLKSDFLAARHIAFLAIENVLPESGKYVDTLDYANYGVQVSLLELAQRASLDLLDKIAVASTEYLELPGKPSSIYFSNRWFQNRVSPEDLKWQPKIDAEIRKGNLPLIALTEVAIDMEEGGYLREKKNIRHSSTHRFTVLHDGSESPYRKSRYIDHYSYSSFSRQVIETLQLTRAALFYFVEMVELHEKHLVKNPHVLPLPLPDYDWVRGDTIS